MTSFNDTWSQAKALAEKSKADLERITSEVSKVEGWKVKPIDKYGIWRAENRKEGLEVTAPTGEALLEKVRAAKGGR